MSDEELLSNLRMIKEEISKDDFDKAYILNKINVMIYLKSRKQNKSSDYIDTLMKDLN